MAAKKKQKKELKEEFGAAGDTNAPRIFVGTAIPGLPRSRSIFLVLFVGKKNAFCRESRDIFRSVSVHCIDIPCSLQIYV